MPLAVCWSQFDNPIAGVRATTTRAAGGGASRHVCNAIIASLVNPNGAARSFTGVVLVDGPSGGTVLWKQHLIVPATIDTIAKIEISDLNIIGSPNTAMTLEFEGATDGGSYQLVTLVGYTGNLPS